jgi:hypothetical protein
MSSKEEKRRRAKLVKEIARKERQEAIAAMPISLPDLGALFDYLDVKLSEKNCDHTVRLTTEFLQQKKVDTAKALPWLREYGGYCDCEVLMNVENEWEDEINRHKQ